MRLENTKGALKVLEMAKHPGMDQVLSLMSAVINDVYEETEKGICSLDMVTKKGNEEGFLNALDNVALELVELMDKIDSGIMPEGLEVYAETVLDSKECVQKLADITRQWKSIGNEGRELEKRFSEETKKLAEEEKKVKELKNKLEVLNMSETAYQREQERLEKALSELPDYKELLKSREYVLGQRKRHAIVLEYISNYINDFSTKERNMQKFELAEEKCRDSLDKADKILRELEGHYSMMLKFVDMQRKERENVYAGK